MYQLTPCAYTFTHVYMNTMQQGIQSLHVIGEFIANYAGDLTSEPEAGWDAVREWASDYKVVKIVSAGGTPDFDEHMEATKAIAKEHNLPFTSFREPDNYDQITAFGIILTPEAVHEIESARELILEDNSLSPVERAQKLDDFPLVQHLKQFPSAR